MTKESNLKLRATKPVPTQVNKRLVWGLITLVLLLVAIVFVVALSDSNHTRQQKEAARNTRVVLDDKFKGLPGSYADRDALDKYLLNDGGAGNALKQQVSSLQAEQARLQQQLQAMSQQPTADNSEASKQAQMSGLFFPGSNPKTDNNDKAKVDKGKAEARTPYHQEDSYQKQNMQSQKIAFLKDSGKDQGSIYNMHALAKPASPYEVQAGTLIPSVMITAVNTSLPGEVVASVRQDIYNSINGQSLLIPKGSKIIGQYDSQVSYGQQRVLIVFNRIIRPDGSSMLIHNASGADLFGQAGMKGSIDNHWGQVIGAAVLSTTLSLGAGSVGSNSFGGANNTFYPNSAQGAFYGAANNVSQVGQDITNRSLNVQPTLTIPAGYEFNIIVNKDMILPPMTEES